MDILAGLCGAYGVSGEENEIGALCARLLGKYGSVTTDCLGNVICEVGRQDPSKKTLLLNAHIDEIGMIVNHITDYGFLRVSKCGGIDERVLPAAQVTVYGKQKLYGIITSVPPHLQSESTKAVSLEDLYVDIGMSGERAKELISIGDRVLIEASLSQLGELYTSKALDDRCCAAAVLYALEQLDGKQSAYNIKVLFSVQEEVGARGAKTGAFQTDADLALILDVSFGCVHGESEEEVGIIGNGAMIGVSPVLNRKLSDALINVAKTEDLPYQLEVMGGKTGTDADAVSVSRNGIAACTVSIPIRYMHTPVETVRFEDIENTARLIASFCERGLF